jgi:hypothetical protein
MVEPNGLSGGETLRIVNGYIGVEGGYLLGFSYRGLREFYQLHCDLDIDPEALYPNSTTRERFMSVLKESSPDVQARILRGLIERVPEPTANPSLVTRSDIENLVHRLEGLPVPQVKLSSPREVVERALLDADVLLERRDAVSAVDRLHTAMHGYLKAACDNAGIAYERDWSATRLLRILRESHPALQEEIARSDEIGRILMSFGGVVDAFGSIRNNASLAHPNEFLLGDAEAKLVVNACRTILHYLEMKLGDLPLRPEGDS